MMAAFAGIPLKEALALKPSLLVQGASSVIEQDALNFFNLSTFTPHVDTVFRVRLGDEKFVNVRLVKVEDLLAASGKKSATGGECFSLRFTGPRGRSFKQGTYDMDHPALGDFSMFLVPISSGKSDHVIYYEAVVNRCLG
jgi:hypothetical protein